MRNGTFFSIMGMNRRNREFVYDGNVRSLFPVAASKLRTKEALQGCGVPTPKLCTVFRSHREVRELWQRLDGLSSFVIKPDHGAQGNGVLIVSGRTSEGCLIGGGKPLEESRVVWLLHEILSGEFCPTRGKDVALIEERVAAHPRLSRVCGDSAPDIRVILCRGEPIMAMVRFPTAKSQGKANLHQAGVGAGVSMETGRIVAAIQRDRPVKIHPDTAHPLIGLEVPLWREVVETATRCYSAIPLDYMGVDVMIDVEKGPVVVEVNVRPGLSIQNANNEGLGSRLAKVMQKGEKCGRSSHAWWAKVVHCSRARPVSRMERGVG